MASESEAWLGFVQMPTFVRQWSALGLTDDDLRSLESAILADPSRAAVIPGGNGLRKIRFGGPRGGKSGGFRVIYLYIPGGAVIVLCVAFGKSRQADLEKDALESLARQARVLKKLYGPKEAP